MSHLLNSTRFKSPNPAANPFDITIPATSAGSTLVIVAGGGATIQAKLGVGGTNFTKRTNSLGDREVVAQDIVDSTGGTTTIEFALNGAQNIDGMIFEFASGSLGNFITGANQGGSEAPFDQYRNAVLGPITTTGPSVLFTMFTLRETDPSPSPANRFWGLEPVGKQYANEVINNDPSSTQYWSLIGASDQANAGTFTGKSSNASGGNHQSVIWAYEDLEPGTPTYTNPYDNAIAAENSLPGSYWNTWFGATTNPNIAGYTDHMSYSPGDAVNFNVDSNNTGFDVEIFRHGFYNYVTWGAKWKATVTGSPAVQPAPTIDAYGGTICAWSSTATWSIPADATPGVYIYNMRRTDNASFVAAGIFVVKSPVPGSQNNQVMVATSEFSWQAYNIWGSTNDCDANGYTGRSLYGQGNTSTIPTRSFAVSFDRPIGTISSNPATFYWDSEGSTVNFLEGNGYDIAYFGSTDLDVDKTIPSKFKAAISQGHSEYWTQNLRDAYENARDAGTNLVFLTSNTSLWHVRFDPTDTDRRTMICYKDSHDTTGWDNTTKYDPVVYTGTWRDPRTNAGGVNNTNRRPESGMTGQWFIGNGTFTERVGIASDFASSPIWRNTRLSAGPSISVRGTANGFTASPTTNLVMTTPSGLQKGDLIVISYVFNGNPGGIDFGNQGYRQVRVRNDGSNQTTIVAIAYSNISGAQPLGLTWSGNMNATATMTVYANAIWQDVDTSLLADTSGGTTHTTRTISNGGSNRWAITVFADTTASSGTKTTTWTPGTGLTSRAATTNNSNGSGPWASIAMMDTNGAVSSGAHSYSATADQANAHAAAGIFYISPGVVLPQFTIGTEWDYVKRDEPSTPQNLVMLSEQALPLQGLASDYNGHDYSESDVHKYGLSLYKANSGALVFNAGTWRYQIGASYYFMNSTDFGNPVDNMIQQSIINLLGDMGVSPTTLLTLLQNGGSTALVSPGAPATPADYGLTISPANYQSIFLPQSIPVSTNINDGVDYTMGTVFTADTSGKIYGIKWYFPDVLPDAEVIGLLYSWSSESSGTELARITFNQAQSGWNYALFSSPVTITANTKYVATIWSSDTVVTTNNTFQSSGVTSGNLTAVQDTGAAHNGKYIASVGSPSYPVNPSPASNSYAVDVVFLADAPGGANLTGWGIPLG